VEAPQQVGIDSGFHPTKEAQVKGEYAVSGYAEQPSRPAFIAELEGEVQRLDTSISDMRSRLTVVLRENEDLKLAEVQSDVESPIRGVLGELRRQNSRLEALMRDIDL
jgi:hypothetical protein